MPVRAVLFDVGGPIDTEVIYERLIDRHIREALRVEGIDATDDAFADAERRSVESFAPDAYAAIIWQLCRGDTHIASRAYVVVAARSGERHAARGGFELRPGIEATLARIHARGVALGLAANQPADALARMERAGIARYFTALGVSGSHGLRKPDIRLFVRACDDLGVPPEACAMVGDRIDNDIVPARALGMHSVLFRTGRHRLQQPRSTEEVPVAEVATVAELDGALDALLDRT
jgi:HAD superfamily hydrolase (TIGR01549 family)